MALTIGQVKRIQLSGYDYEWSIQNFIKITKKLNKNYSSPMFSFAGHDWCLKIYINQGRRDPVTGVGHIGLYLRRLSSGFPIKLEFYLGLKSVDGRKDPELHRSFDFQKADTGFGMSSYLSLFNLLKKKDELMPSGVLTVVCTLKRTDPHERRMSSLSQVYKNMFLNGTNHDIILKVGDQIFKAHKDILMARSRVFQCMLTHDMTEKNSGEIDVPDCDPQAMEAFLLYVYSGKIDCLDQSNMFGLYYIADKYGMADLKGKCYDFIIKSLSPNNVCEAIKMATDHNDASLLENATDYFYCNCTDIMKTAEWLSFLKSDVNLGNSLIIESFDIMKEFYTAS